MRSNEITVCKTLAQPGSDAFTLCSPNPLSQLGFAAVKGSKFSCGGGSQVSPGCPAFVRCVGDHGLTQCPAYSPGPCLAGVATVMIIGPRWLALLAPFVQSSGHILVARASARA